MFYTKLWSSCSSSVAVIKAKGSSECLAWQWIYNVDMFGFGGIDLLLCCWLLLLLQSKFETCYNTQHTAVSK